MLLCLSGLNAAISLAGVGVVAFEYSYYDVERANEICWEGRETVSPLRHGVQSKVIGQFWYG